MVTTEDAPTIPREELHITFARSSAPGGQNVNKVNSKAVMHWQLVHNARIPSDVRARFLARFGNRVNNQGEVVVSCDEFRDQGRNVESCLNKLMEMLSAAWTRPKSRRPTRPTRASVRRRLGEKQEHSRKKRQRQDRGNDD
jgi:ribosome-associated protein